MLRTRSECLENPLNIQFPSAAVFALLACFVAQSAVAQTRYISDELDINVRTGKTSKHRIVSVLSSGTKVTIIEQDDSGWSQVRMPNGKEGWVLTRYLSSQPVARDQLASMQRASKQKDKQLLRMQEKLDNLTRDRSELQQEKARLEAENAALEGQFNDISATAARTLEINDANRSLEVQVSELVTERDKLTYEINYHRDRRDHMIIGGLICGAGILIGLILPRLGRKKSGWGGGF